MEYNFIHMKTPGWANSNSIYYRIIYNKTHEEVGYIGIQDYNFTNGVCGNICYRIYNKFQRQGHGKTSFKEFIHSRIFDFDIYEAYVKKDNIASIKILESCGFNRKEDNKRAKNEKYYFYSLKKYEIE